MIYKAKVSFSGVISMDKGDLQDIPDKSIADDLLKAGYIQPADKPKATTNRRKKKDK